MIYVYLAVSKGTAGILIQRTDGVILSESIVTFVNSEHRCGCVLKALSTAAKKLVILYGSGLAEESELIRVLVPSRTVYGWLKAGKSADSCSDEFDRIYNDYQQLRPDVEFICIDPESRMNKAYHALRTDRSAEYTSVSDFE